MLLFLKKNLYQIFLVLILILGFFLRFYKLDTNPYGFFCDEASIGYNAYSLINSGTDEWGVSWPLFFKAFGEFKGPIMIYSTLPFVYFLGLSELSVRLVSVLYGTATIIAIYFLGKRLFNRQVGLISALLLAISPWHIHFSRVNLEGLIPFVFFTVLATCFWLKFLKTKITSGYLSILFFSLAFYSYFPARIFIPPFFIFLVFSNLKFLLRNYKGIIKLFIFGLILITPMILHLTFGEGLSRWQQVRGDFNLLNLTRKYFQYFSSDFLFFQGDIDFNGQFITRHSVRGLGELYLLQLPFILISIFYLIKALFKKEYLTILVWLFIYPFCDLFTSSVSPQATRTIIGVIPFQILTSLGIYQLFKFLKNKFYKITTIAIISILFVTSFLNYQKLYQKYSQYSSDFWGWQSGPKEILTYFKSHQSEYAQLCLEGVFNAPEIFIKFYDPKNICQGKCQICSLESLDQNKKQLFAISAETFNGLSQKTNLKEIIYYPNQQPAFYLINFE